MTAFENALRARCPELTAMRHVPLRDYTTLRVGGPADYFLEPENEEQLCAALQAAKETDTALLLLGNGSNLLVRDGGFRGAAVRLGKRFSSIVTTENGFYAQAGVLLSALSKAALDRGMTGLEFAQGIPGSVGGGAYMNAGAYGGEMGQVISAVRIWDGETVRDADAADMDFAYRHTKAMDQSWTILGAEFALTPGDPKAIEEKMRDYSARRREKQPLEYPSAGSFFKRPSGHFAGALIEQSNLKGHCVGGAQVSEKHAGFLINRGGATADDFLRLMEHVQRMVQEKFGVMLEPEVRIVGSGT